MQLSVLFIDLDHFKILNDTQGHHVGDLLLRDAAKRIRSVIRTEDLAARIGGDEFAIVLTDITSSLNASHVAKKLIKELESLLLLTTQK